MLRREFLMGGILTSSVVVGQGINQPIPQMDKHCPHCGISAEMQGRLVMDIKETENINSSDAPPVKVWLCENCGNVYGYDKEG